MKLEVTKPHRCQKDDTCTCNPSEPNEKCPKHGDGSQPPRCIHCGRMQTTDFDYFLAYDTLINLARASGVSVIDYFPFRAHNAFTIGPGPDFNKGQEYLILIQPTKDLKARLCALAHELGHWFEPHSALVGIRLEPIKLTPKDIERGTSESTAHHNARAILELISVPDAKTLYTQALTKRWKW